MRKLHQRRQALLVLPGILGLFVLSACNGSGGSGSGPLAVGSSPANPTEAPDTGQVGTGRAGDITVPRGSYVPVQGGVSLRLALSNTGATADRLVRADSNLGPAGTLTPDPIPLPARSTVRVDGASTSITLPLTARLDPGETVAVTLTFATNGSLLVYAIASG